MNMHSCTARERRKEDQKERRERQSLSIKRTNETVIEDGTQQW